TLSILSATLREALGFSEVEYSYIVTVFLVAYAVGYLFCGTVIDRLGGKLPVGDAPSAWAIAGSCHAFATTSIGPAASPIALGLGESFSAPCGIKAITEWIPKRERGLCTAIFSNGNIIGGVIAVPVVSYLGRQYGWPWAFVVTGAAGFLYLVFWIW